MTIEERIQKIEQRLLRLDQIVRCSVHSTPHVITPGDMIDPRPRIGHGGPRVKG